MFRKLAATTPTWFALPLRLSMGLLFTLHGAEKVFGLRGGPGLSAWMANERAATGLRPAWLWLGAAALFELIGGVLILIGLLTRLGALLVMPIMLVAIYGGLTGGEGGPVPLPRIGYPLVMLGAAIALLVSGGGRASIDESLARSRRWR
ncbi:MAG TPA: DoxX family protein [Pyrinomonadaceae bacterium]|nr:DoxX family protein [Pyrinomonadaceae bacterium]